MSLTECDHTVFSNAIESGNSDTVKSMLTQYPDLANHSNWTPPPLHCAVLWNQPKIAEILLDHGAEIDLRDPDRQTTPLRYAIMYCKTEVIPLLLSRGANLGPIADGGSTAFQLAQNAANGAFEEYDDLPPREAYTAIIEVLQKAGE